MQLKACSSGYSFNPETRLFRLQLDKSNPAKKTAPGRKRIGKAKGGCPILSRLIGRQNLIPATRLICTLALLNQGSSLADTIQIDLPRAQAVLIVSDLDQATKADWQRSWGVACDLLKSNLSEHTGPHQHGVFSEIVCEELGVAGAKLVQRADHDWIIEVAAGQETSTISIFYRPTAKNIKVVRQEAKLTINHSSDFLKILEDSAKNKLIAANLLTQLPMMKRFDSEKTRRRFLLKADGHDAPPREYMIYSLEFSPDLGLWLPRVRGYARQSATPDRSTFLYSVVIDRNVISTGQLLWAHDVKGRRGGGTLDWREKTAVEAESKTLEANMIDFFRQSLSANYSGFRYGYPLLSGDQLISKSSMVGIFTEIRGGPLQGFRWSWDFAPEVKEYIDGTKYAIVWNRNSIGWSFDIRPPLLINQLVSQLNVFPSIGLLDFNATLPLFDAQGNLDGDASFSANKSIDFSIEFSAEKLLYGRLFRFWLASSLAGLIPMPKTDVEVSSFRVGVDNYFNLFTLPYGIGTSALLFTSYERKGLVRTQKPSSGSDEALIQGLSFDLFFAGFGLAISW